MIIMISFVKNAIIQVRVQVSPHPLVIYGIQEHFLITFEFSDHLHMMFVSLYDTV